MRPGRRSRGCDVEELEVRLSLPFTGRWQVRNSPARRVPSHGTDLLGERYAIDFVAVDDRGRTASRTDWRTVVGPEPPERFFAFGRPILAPADGIVIEAQDREADHEARRSPLALVPYMLGQGERLRAGIGAIAGNYVFIALSDGAVAALVHLRAGSVCVDVGERVRAGQHIADCGNSGNSTQPHVHLQVMDGSDTRVARGLPIAFTRYREWRAGAPAPEVRESGVPDDGVVVESLQDPTTTAGRPLTTT